MFSGKDGFHLSVVPLVPTQARLAFGGCRGQGVKQGGAALLQNNFTHGRLAMRVLQMLQVERTRPHQGGRPDVAVGQAH